MKSILHYEQVEKEAVCVTAASGFEKIMPSVGGRSARARADVT